MIQSAFTAKKWAILILAILSAIWGCSGPERKAYRGNSIYMPLAQERVLKYEQHLGSDTQEFTVSLNYVGGHRTKVYGVRYQGIKPEYCEFREQDSLVYFVTDQPLTKLDSDKGLSEYAEVWVNENARTGDAWENTDTGTQTVFTGFESITVSAGHYDNCYKTTTEAIPALFDSLDARLKSGDLGKKEYQQQTSDAHIVIIRWFAPRVGLVKEQFGSEDHTIELLSIEKEGFGAIDSLAKGEDIQELFMQEEPR